MGNYFVEIFYYFLPTTVLVTTTLLLFQEEIKKYNFFKEIFLSNSNYFLYTIIFLSFFIGLFVEIISRFIIKELIIKKLKNPYNDEEMAKIHKANRLISSKHNRNLIEFFSTRSAFFRNTTIVIPLICLTILIKHPSICNFSSLVVIGGITTFFCYKSYFHYFTQENSCILGYANDENITVSKKDLDLIRK